LNKQKFIKERWGTIKFTEIKQEIERQDFQTAEQKLNFLFYYMGRLRFQKFFEHMHKVNRADNPEEVNNGNNNRGFNHIHNIDNMHPGKIPLLRLLYKSQKDSMNLSLKEISERLNIQPPSLTVMLNRMEKDGLITRERDKNDARRQIISLNKKGMELSEKYFQMYKTIESKIFEGLTDTEKNCFFDVIMKIIENLTKI